MRRFLALVCGLAALSPSAIAAANNNDDGFIWIDANTRIKVKPVSTAGGGTSAPEKATPEKAEKGEKAEKKEKPKK